MTDWPAWHHHYDDPSSSLSRRLQVVQRNLAELVTQHAPHRLLGLCAGDGRDVIPVLAALSREHRPEVVLVELEQRLAAAAKARAESAGVDVTVVVGDAGVSATWCDHVPVDLLMLCGIFGNISVDDIKNTIAATPTMVSAHGVVVWTRGASPPRGLRSPSDVDGDLRPHIRQWFLATGFSELAYEAEAEGYGVGVNQRETAASSRSLPDHLFAFQQ